MECDDLPARSRLLVNDWESLRLEHPWVIVHLQADAGVTIERIQTWPQARRRQGHATAALADCCRLADLHRVVLFGYPWPFTGRDEDRIWLCAWIERHGFLGDPTDVRSTWIRLPPGIAAPGPKKRREARGRGPGEVPP